jgi:hypothetical protein
MDSGTPPRPGRPVAGIVLVAAVIGLSGCASGFVSGGVATASVSDNRIAVDSRVASAEIGPDGPRAGTQRRTGALCVTPGGATVAC